MKKEEIYWTTKTGQRILIDDMDLNHLRNALKLIVRNINKFNSDRQDALKKRNRQIQINGELASEHADAFEIYQRTGVDIYDEDFFEDLP
jgi:hypothetical protein